MLQVRAIYDTIFSDITGCSSDIIAVSQPTLAGLMQAAAEKYGKKFGKALGDMPTVTVLVNGHRLNPSDKLNDGDEVAFLVPISGG
ncbi:MAG: MoaD/ThiS family protein [Chloroflexi bacterium]|nr:MoaD/ThiS family protein [Chloroflexota bacterium]